MEGIFNVTAPACSVHTAEKEHNRMYANYGGHKYEREHELYRVFLKQHCTILLQITHKKSANICACLT